MFVASDKYTELFLSIQLPKDTHIYLKDNLVANKAYNEVFYFKYVQTLGTGPFRYRSGPKKDIGYGTTSVEIYINETDTVFVDVSMIDIPKSLPKLCEALDNGVSLDYDIRELITENL